EIVNYAGTGSSSLREFLNCVAGDMALGAGGEDVNLLQGVTLQQIESPSAISNVALFQASASTGASRSSSDAATGVPFVQLAGFCDWSVRFSPTGGAGAGKRGSGQGPFLVQLHPVDPSKFLGSWIDINTRGVWSGAFTLTDQDGDSVTGVLTGLVGPGPDPQHTFQFRGILVATHGVGRWAAALGNGHVTITWGNTGFDGPFQADLELPPAGQRKGGQRDQRGKYYECQVVRVSGWIMLTCNVHRIGRIGSGSANICVRIWKRQRSLHPSRSLPQLQ